MATHPDRALTPSRVNALTKPGKYADGNGLYLVVDHSGSKRWILRTTIHGRRCDMGLGSCRLVSLGEARERARRFRLAARDGGDPLSDRRKARKVVPSFADAANSVHKEHLLTWKNAKHQAQWINTLRQYAIPIIGNKRVDLIETPDILRVLGPIWLIKPETAKRVRQRIGTVLDWAKASGYRDGPNAIDGVGKALPRQPEAQSHFAAMAYMEVPAFIHTLRTSSVSEPTRLAFEFLILTAARTSEVMGAKWKEIDLDGQIWTVPANRMKAGTEHRVPLSDRATEILRRAKELSQDGELVFDGRTRGKPLSNMAFLMTLRRMNLDVTTHGFRSAFRDWAAEKTNVSREVCEAALAHAIQNKTEAAYRRGDLFEKRRALMKRWSDFATATPAQIVQLKLA